MKKFIVLCFLDVLLSSCYYSPWEELTYDICNGAPETYEEVILNIWGKTIGCGKYSNFFVGDTLFSVGLIASGHACDLKGPYKLYVFMARRGLDTSDVFIDKIQLYRTGVQLPIFEQSSVRVVMQRTEKAFIMKGKFIAGEYSKELPDILNPKDGKNVVVKLEVISPNEIGGLARKSLTNDAVSLDFDFRPKVLRGSLQSVFD